MWHSPSHNSPPQERKHQASGAHPLLSTRELSHPPSLPREGVLEGGGRGGNPLTQPQPSNGGAELNYAGYTWRSRPRPTLRWDRIGEGDRPQLGEETSSVRSNWIWRLPEAASNTPSCPGPLSPASGGQEETDRAGAKSICADRWRPPGLISLLQDRRLQGPKGPAGGCEEARARRGAPARPRGIPSRPSGLGCFAAPYWTARTAGESCRFPAELCNSRNCSAGA